MRLALVLALAVPALAPVLAQPGAASQASLLSGLRDRARPVLIFAGPDDTRARQQYDELLRHACELQDRQMVVLLATRTPVAARPAPPAGTVQATQDERQTLRSTFHVGQDAFAVVLVGKDGGEKFRSARPVSFATLRSLVDAMPMRRQEEAQRQAQQGR